ELVRLLEQPLRARSVEAREGGAAESGCAAELDDPRDAEAARRPLGLHPDPVADAVVLSLRRRLVDHDLAPPRPAARDEHERVERRVAAGDAEAEVRRAAEDDRLPLAVDERGRPRDAALG